MQEDMQMRGFWRTVATGLGAALVLATAGTVGAWSDGPWSAASSIETIAGTSGNLNTAALEGCPFVAQRGDVLYFASNRPGGMGGLDIWFSLRGEDGSWGNPVNFAAVNSSANELCPMAHRNGRTFLFVSARAGGCGGDDLYVTRRHETRGWAAPQNLGCTVNSASNEASPSLLETELYFSSTRNGGLGDLFVSAFDGQAFGAPTAVAALNSLQDDFRPNLRRDGLEIFFDSNRPGGLGGLDLWTATRATTSDAWSTPVNLGVGVNSPVNDLRASLSWDGTTLYFGSLRAGGEGSQDLYVITR
jgi:Tol biopolymer transport system component